MLRFIPASRRHGVEEQPLETLSATHDEAVISVWEWPLWCVQVGDECAAACSADSHAILDSHGDSAIAALAHQRQLTCTEPILSYVQLGVFQLPKEFIEVIGPASELVLG